MGKMYERILKALLNHRCYEHCIHMRFMENSLLSMQQKNRLNQSELEYLKSYRSIRSLLVGEQLLYINELGDSKYMELLWCGKCKERNDNQIGTGKIQALIESGYGNSENLGNECLSFVCLWWGRIEYAKHVRNIQKMLINLVILPVEI